VLPYGGVAIEEGVSMLKSGSSRNLFQNKKHSGQFAKGGKGGKKREKIPDHTPKKGST